ncbi:MAG: cholesterol oxidase, partial [Candidatus Marinimicrobia bacterium]|nr:cholesterol oxidase [Candidatus Neomarinimicrobiota bacterium]
LLFKCSQNGSLPGLSLQLGNYVRTNSEALVAAKARGGDEDYSKGLAISTGIYPDAYTHIETVRYGQGQDVMSLLATSLTGGGKPWPRPLRWLAATFRHPIRVIRNLNPFGWAKRTIVLLVMQTRSNYMRLEFKRRWWRLGGRSMNTFWTTDQRVPSHIPVANDFAKRMAAKMKGDAFSVLPEVVFDTSSTAHILGGCIMGASAADGVIDFTGKVHGYDNLYVVDGSMVPANLGVNPSLTITAMAEYVMSQLPEKQDP